MKIRRYMGKNAQEAILRVKMDLGNEAVILNTRKVRRKGLLKYFAKPLVEVLAAIDDDYNKKHSDNKAKSSNVKKTPDIESVNNEKDEQILELENKIKNIENMVDRMYSKTRIKDDKPPTVEKAEKQPASSKIYDTFMENMLKNEVDYALAQKIIKKAKSIAGDASIDKIASCIYNIIYEMLGKPETIKLKKDNKPTIVMLVGPTGVGKTTTLAKIAADYSLNNGKEVGFITADTYRIAAVEQLKTYAEILGIPLTVVYSTDDIPEAINLHSDKEIIFIDTAGRSYKNKAHFEELKTIVEAFHSDEVYLVLSATVSMSNCNEIIKNYSFLKDYKLLFTKLDETKVNGIILNSCVHTGKKLSYITNGQNVPDDIETVDVERIIKSIMGSSK